MYLLYLDDSGSISNQDEEYFVLGGVCLPETSIYWHTEKIDAIAKRINQAAPVSIEFHASEIYSGKSAPWNSYKKPDRINIIREVLNTFRDAYLDTVIFACAIQKQAFKNQDIMQMAFEDLCSRFQMYLNRMYAKKKESTNGIIVFDKNAYEGPLQQLTIQFKQMGTKWGTKINNICEVPFFVDSKASRLIQLADHIAYAVFRRYNAQDLKYFNCIEGRFDSESGKIYGLSHKASMPSPCTCPSCITKHI